jgi:hypothetical protein
VTGLPSLRGCDCGEMHLVSPEVAAACDDSPTVTMVTGNGAWEVPRVYAEHHHPGTPEVELLAAIHGWKPWNPGFLARNHFGFIKKSCILGGQGNKRNREDARCRARR